MVDNGCISEMMLVQNQMKEELERQDSLIVELTNRLGALVGGKAKIVELSNHVSMTRNMVISMDMRLKLVEEELNRYKNL